MKQSSTTQRSAGHRVSRVCASAAALAVCAVSVPEAAAEGFFQSLQSQAQAPIQPVPGAKSDLPPVPGFTMEQTFHSDFPDDSLSMSRGIYANAAGTRVDFSMRTYASPERATKALAQDVDALLRGGGAVASREFGRDGLGNYIEVARCARNGLSWAHWVIGDKKFVAAGDDAGLERFLGTCPAWSRQPRVQWLSAPFPAYEKAAAARLPIVFYCFLNGGYSDDFERHVLATPEFNAQRDRAVFIAIEPDVDDAKGNGAKVKSDLGVSRYPFTAVVTVEPGPVLLERAKVEGYRPLQEVMMAFGGVLPAAPPAPAPAAAQALLPAWPASPFSRPLGSKPLDLSKIQWRWKQ